MFHWERYVCLPGDETLVELEIWSLHTNPAHALCANPMDFAVSICEKNKNAMPKQRVVPIAGVVRFRGLGNRDVEM